MANKAAFTSINSVQRSVQRFVCHNKIIPPAYALASADRQCRLWRDLYGPQEDRPLAPSDAEGEVRIPLHIGEG